MDSSNTGTNVDDTLQSSALRMTNTRPHTLRDYFADGAWEKPSGDSTMPFTGWEPMGAWFAIYMLDRRLDPGGSLERPGENLMAWVTPLTPWVPGLNDPEKYRALRNFEPLSDCQTYDWIQRMLEDEAYLSLSPHAVEDVRYQSLEDYCPLLQRVDVLGQIWSEREAARVSPVPSRPCLRLPKTN